MLEELEARVLLSADVSAVSLAAAADAQTTPMYSADLVIQVENVNASGVSDTPSAAENEALSSEIFAGISAEEITPLDDVSGDKNLDNFDVDSEGENALKLEPFSAQESTVELVLQTAGTENASSVSDDVSGSIVDIVQEHPEGELLAGAVDSTAATSGADLESVSGLSDQVQQAIAAAGLVSQSTSSPNESDDSGAGVTGSAFTNISTDESIETLRAANAPPTQVVDGESSSSVSSNDPSAVTGASQSDAAAVSSSSSSNSLPETTGRLSQLATATSGVVTAEIGDPALIFRIFDNESGADSIPDVEVLRASDNVVLNTFNDVTDIDALRSGFNDTIKVDLDADTVWDLTGLNEGNVTVDGFGTIHFSSVENLLGFDSTTGKKDTFVIDQLGGVTGDVDDQGGVLEIQLFDFFYFSGDIDFQKANGNFVRNDGTVLTGDYKLLSGTGVNGFVGNGPVTDPSRVGLELTNIDFTLLLFTDTAPVVDITYTALKTSGGTASLIGLSDFLLGAWSFNVEVNRTSDSANSNRVLDFNDGTSDLVAGTPVTPTVGPAIDFEGEDGSLLDVAGSAVLEAYGVVMAKGSFKVQLGTVTELGEDGAIGGTGADADTEYQSMVLTLGAQAFTGASAVEVFIGVGGELEENDPGYADDELNLDSGLGFHATLNSLSLVTLKNNNKTPTVATDDTSYLGLELTDLSAELIGIDGLTLGVYGVGLKVNQAKDSDTDATNDPDKLDWTSFFDNTEGLEPATVPQVGAGVDIEAQGSVILDAFGVVMAKGSFKVQLGTVTELGEDGAIGGTGADADTEYQSMVLTLGTQAFTGASAVEVFIGVGGELEENDPGYADDELNLDSGLGFHATLNSLSLVTLKNNNKTPTVATDDTSYLGLELTDLSAELIGIDSLTLGVYGVGLKVNQAKDSDTDATNDPDELDWTSFFDNTEGLEPATVPQVGAGVDIEAQGSVILDAFGVVMAKGSFKVQLGTVTELGEDGAIGGTGADADTEYQSMVLTLGTQAFTGASAVEVFIGVGGELEENDPGYADDELNLDSGLGFHATLNSLSLVTLKNNNKTPTNAADDKSYLALDAGPLAAEFVGVDESIISLSVWDVTLKVNQAKDSDTNPNNNPAKLNWTTFFENTEGLEPGVDFDVDSTVDISASGSAAISIAGFVQVYGSFAFSKLSAVSVTSVAQNGVSTSGIVTDVITFGLEDVNVFVGDGPYFQDSDGDDDIDGDDDVNQDAVGLLLEDVDLALALFKPTTALGNYYAVSARAESIQLVGLNLPASDAFKLEASGYRIEVNGGSNGTGPAAVNFTALQGGNLTVETGPNSEVVFDYSSILQRVAIEDALLTIDDFVYVSGGFSFTRQQGMAVTLSGSGTPVTRVVDTLAFGAGNVDIFVGSGPYFIDSDGDGDVDALDERGEGAVGLAIENVNFGLMVMRPSGVDAAFSATKYIALKATANFAGLVGVDQVKLSATGIVVEYNWVNNPSIPNDTKVVDFTKLAGGSYTLDTGNGELEFNYDSKLLRASVEVAEMQFDSYVFVRGGLAFTKTAGFQVQLTDGSLPRSVSAINIGGEDLTMFFGVDGPYWIDLDGDNDITWAFDTGDGDDASRTITAGSVTIDSVEYTVGDILPRNTVGTVSSGVLSFGSGESAVSYGDIDGDGDVDADETGELNESAVGLAITDADLALALLKPTNAGDLTRYVALKASSDFVGFVGTDAFQLEASSVVVELNIATRTGATQPLPVVNFSALNGGAGYSILTGAGTTVIDFSSRRIHASADDVLVNISEFLYLNGNIALDLGSRETVTVRTSIPSNIGALAGSAVAALNSALTTLEGELDSLKTQVQTAIQNAITTVINTINSQIESIIDTIVAQLQSSLEQAISTVTSSVKSQLESATAGLANSMDSVIDGMLDPIVEDVPEPLDILVGGLLSPMKGLIRGVFGDTIKEALNGSIDRIAGSVSAAVQAGLQSVAAQVKAKIHSVLDPQIVRVVAKLNQLIQKVEDTISPIFTRIHSLLNIEIGDNFATIENVEVDVTAIGISEANAFIGMPPAGGLDFDSDLSEQGAIGLYVQNFNMGLGIFKPVVSQLPEFVAAKITADSAGFTDGGADLLTLTADGITVELNLGGPVVPGTGDLFGNGTIDFEESFPGDDGPPEVPAGFRVDTGTTSDPIYLDFQGERILASVELANIQISEFVHIRGSIAFEKGRVESVNVKGGLLSQLGLNEDVGDFLEGLGLPPELIDSFPVASGSTQVSFMTIGASNVHAFIGMDGPYWTDDLNHNNTIDTNEINSDAVGLVVNDFDFGLAMMRSTNPLDLAKYFALRASAKSISFEGIEGVTVNAHDLKVEVNLSSPSIYGIPIFPVVDFETTFDLDERQALFNVFDSDKSHSISVAEMTAALGSGHGVTQPITTVDELIAALNLPGPQPPFGAGSAAILSLDEVLPRLTETFKNAIAPSQTLKNIDRLLAADADGDGKFDPAGFEINTGGDPVYLTMDSPIIRAQGFLELNLFDTIILTGSVAFEMGGTQDVTLSDGNEKTVTTMTLGAANVTAFIGANGPYWTDLDGDHEVDESTELSDDAVGFHITDLDIGLMVMASINPSDLGVYVAAKLNVHSFGLVGIDGLTANGAFDVALNVGVGLSGFEPSLAVVDFPTSFSEAPALFDLLDTDNNGVIGQAEQNAALAGGYIGADIPSVEQLVSLLNTNGGPPDDYLTISEVRTKLKDSFEASHQAAINDLDVDDNGRLNTGFEVNTGNPASPVVLDFNQFLISIQLGGEIELDDVFRLYGVFLFEVNPAGLKAFVAAGLEVGPDIGASQNNKLFTMNALGALVINGDGIAADIDVSASVGGALSSVIKFNASARMVFNTTGEAQEITIPERYVDFLDGTTALSELPGSGLNDPTQLASLTGTLDGRFTVNPDGSATYTISAGAPSFDGQFNAAGVATVNGGFDAPGAYFVIYLHGDMTIVNTFVITADFYLKVSDQGLELGFNGTIDLGGFVTLNVKGGAVIENGVFAAYIGLTVNFDVAGINISGGAVLEINSGSNSKNVYDALGTAHPVAAHTFKVSVDATIDLFGIFEATGSVTIGVENGVFSVDVDASIDFFGIVDVAITGHFSVASNGSITFSFTGTLDLDLTVGSGAGEFGITGGLSVTITNTSFSGSGSVGLVIFGEDINIASAEVSVDWGNGSWSVYAEGPLSVWLRVSGNADGTFSIDGGLGVFDAVFEALGDAAEAIGEAVVAAAEAVADALEDLGQAILDFGEDVIEFFDGLLTDIADLAEAVWDEVSSWFEDEKTEVIDLTATLDPSVYYSYSANLVGGILTINNATADRLALAIVNGKLIVDAPDVTRNIAVAVSINYERDYTWDGWPPYGEWGDWYEVGRSYVYRDVTFSNMRNFTASSVTKIVINGSNSSETIIIDKNSVSINTDVSGNGGDDVIVTGQGNDRVWGGSGNDTIFTYGGNDELRGEAGADKLMGGTGDDYLDGGSGDDLLDENDDRVSPEIEISEINTLVGGDGVDILLGSPGKDTLEGGNGNDTLVGLANDDTYVFKNSYGTDTFVDYHGKVTLDFSGASSNLDLAMTDAVPNVGFTARAGAGHYLEIDSLTWIELVKLGTGNDDFAITDLPNHQINITDAGGSDTYDFDFDQTDVAQSVARVDIVDNGGTADRIELDVDSTGFDIYVHPLAVLLNNLNLTFNAGVDQLVLTDHAADTTVTTAPGSGLSTLLIKSGVTITSATNGPIEFLARRDFTLQTGALVETDGDVTVRGDNDDADSTGATISLLGMINADHVTVYGGGDNDTVTIGNVTSGSETTIFTYEGSDTVNIRTINAETTINAGAGNDTINVGSTAPTTGGIVDGIAASLYIYGEGGSNILNVDDTGDGNGNSGALTGTTITGLDMTGSITYGAIATLNIGLGTAADTFTITNTHAGATNVNGQNGNDIFNVRAISGATVVNGGSGDETFNVGSTAGITNTSGNVNSIGNDSGDLLTINGNDPTSGSDWLYVDDTGDTLENTGTLTSTTITGLGMSGSISYGTVEHLIISLGSGGDTFTINSTHGAATSASQEETTVNTGAGTDTVHINDVTDLLYVNGQADSDTINVNGTGAGSVSTLNGGGGIDLFNVNGTGGSSASTLNGDDGNDIFNVRAMNGAVNANGGNGADTINVGSNAQGNTSDPDNNYSGTLNSIFGLLTINGGTSIERDRVTLDDTADTGNNTGVLTASRVTGLGMGNADQSIVESALGIAYSNVEDLVISLGSGADSFTINSTHNGATAGTSETTMVNAGAGNDLITINNVSDILVVNGEAGIDTVNVNGTGAGSQSTLNGDSSNDIINVRAISGATTVNAGDGADTINIGSNAAGTTGDANNNSGGTVDSIGALLTINGDGGTGDVLNVDDTGDSNANTGMLNSTTITGLDMAGSIAYGTVETLNIGLGTAGDTFTVTNTHNGVTNVSGHNGNDIFNVRAISGPTTLDGGNGDETFNVGSNAQGDTSDPDNNTGGNVNSIGNDSGDLLTIDGNDPTSGSDWLYVDDTGDTLANTGTLTSTTITGLGMGGSISYGTLEHLIISLGSGGDTFTINSTHGAATSASQEDTTVNTGAGTDTVHINDVTDLLFVNGEGAADTINVNATGVGSVSTLHGNDGDDIFNVRTMNGAVNVNGDNGNDTTNVGSQAPDTNGTVNSINALLTVNGNANSGGNGDVLNVDDTADPVSNAGNLTFDRLTGLGMGNANQLVIESSLGITYGTLEALNINLGSGADQFTIESTHTTYTTINANSGDDNVAVRTISGATVINGGNDNDTINVGRNSLPNTAPANINGVVDQIQALLTVNGGGNSANGIDRLNVDDSGETSSNDGILTSATIKGLDMAAAGINYANLEDLNIWLGTGQDRFYIASTHTSTTQLFTGNGTEVVNATDDSIYINSISGITTINGEEGNDFIEVNVVPVAPNSWSFVRTHLNGIAAVLNLNGLGGSDLYTVHLANQGSALINVHDNGAWDDGVNTLIIEGADVVSGFENTKRPKDLFLLRKLFVALINDADAVSGPSAGDLVERVNYDENINARLIVRGLGGDDKFIVDDNSSITTLDGGDGADYFQVGQVFNTPRDNTPATNGYAGFDAAQAHIAPGDRFETTAVFNGVVKRADGTVIFDPSTETLTSEKATAIENARLAALAAGQSLEGIGYLSNGITHPMTIFGGDGNDVFSTYHNRATLRLEGEEGNDEFVVRAFVRLPGQTASAQAETELNGGAGNDLIQYTINAPVSIEGGGGVDSVVVVGTVFPDAFVVSEDGIFGAGLEVHFSGVEKAELDTLEGDDHIFIRGTSADIVTTIIGGLGNDTIEVMGDVRVPIISTGSQGGSSVIGHSSSSTDSAFNDVGIDGVGVRILDPMAGSLINISEPDGKTRVSEDNFFEDTYLITLMGPLPATFATVYLSISAGVSSTKDKSQNGDSVLVSLDGVTWSKAVVLTLTASDANQAKTVHVRAVQDTGVEGERQVMISHSINSTSSTYNNLALRDVAVTVDDDDLPGVVIRQLEVDPTSNAVLPNQDFESVVLEGGFTDAYQIRLNRAPALNETVTLTLITDGQVTLSQYELTFDANNWDDFQQITIHAADDALEENVLTSHITHHLTSQMNPTGGSPVFDNVTDSKLDVRVYDNETVDIIVRESAGSTQVVKEAGSFDSYYLIFTRAPTQNVTLSISTDGQSEVRLGSSGNFTSQLNITFTPGNWQTPRLIQVQANLSAPTLTGNTLGFDYVPHRLDQIRGPLIIKGGTEPTSNRSLNPSIGLPTETDVPAASSGSSSGSSGSSSFNEANSVDILNIFNDASQAPAAGELTYRDGVANSGYALAGLGMGGALTLDPGTGPVTYAGGITYSDFEVVELLLGKNKETLNIDATSANTVTVIHGGGNDDTFNVSESGDDHVIRGPLVLYGDSAENALRAGGRYSGISGVMGANAIAFNNPGNDIINGQSASAVLTIFGGPGNDILVGGKSGDQIAGGTGNDWIFGQAGADHIYGDSEFNVDLDALVYLIRNPSADDREALNVIVGATAGSDIIRGDEGDDVLIGDHGAITQQAGTRRIFSTANVERVETVLPAVGVSDVIYGNSGNDVILGGLGGDFLYGGNSAGGFAFSFAPQLTAVSTSGQTTVTGKFGVLQNIAISGADQDRIIGDHGFVDFRITDGATVNLATPDELSSSDQTSTTAGDDVIEGNEDNDLIVAGLGADTVAANGGNDVVFADNGRMKLVGGSLTLVQSTELEKGGSDTIRGNSGDDILIGGAFADQIDGGSERDLIFGDNVTLDSTVGDGTANARYRKLTGAQNGQIYSTDPNSAGAVLVGPNSNNIPGGAPIWEGLSITFLDHNRATEIAAGTNFGGDYIAGGAHNDQIFGQLGNDTIQGDGSIDLTVGAHRLSDGTLSVQPSVENVGTDGDDYIEGNGGSDVIFGNLGQDDIIGGSSSLFSLTTPDQRTDASGADVIFGGAGTDVARNNLGDITNTRHAVDADMILGDNGNIYRLLGANGAFLEFNYDQTVVGYEDRGTLRIVVRAAELLDYTEGGLDRAKALNPAVTQLNDIGAADEIHGESGDDFIYGMFGNDVLFGEGQDDDIIGGTGDDWIAAGTGDDGVLGDDGRIFTSRNTYKSSKTDLTLAEPLYGITKIDAVGTAGIDSQSITTPGSMQSAVINLENQLKKTAVQTPFSLNYTPEYVPTETRANDIIFGGLGNDALHGEIGSDAISGAEALPEFYNKPVNPGDILAFNEQTGEFANYDEFNPLTKITFTGGANFILNFDAFDTGAPMDPYAGTAKTDGDDAIFGDLGNDWLVGGTGRDNMFGGFGNDLLNGDDNLDTASANTIPDTHPSYEDRAYGGAGRDVLIANTGGDRLIDWAGEFNSYLVPFAAFGAATVSRAVQPGIAEFLYALSASLGTDRVGPAAVSGGPNARNNEPFGELGLVRQQDSYWHDQTGAPDDPQPGNVPGGSRDVLRSATFNDGTADGFAVDSGSWSVQQGRLEVAPTILGGDAVSVFYVDALRPSYFELKATINAAKPLAGYKANSYIIFDYQNPTDFKFSGVDISIDKMVMGHRDASGWHIDVQVPAQLKPDQDYNVLLAVNGTTATVVINNSVTMSYAFAPRIIDGFSFGLNTGMVGIGSNNAKGRIDNVTAQILPPAITLNHEENFNDGVADLFTAAKSGNWQITNGRYSGLPAAGSDFAISNFNLNLATSSLLKMEATVSAQSFDGLVFDYYNADQFKFAAVVPGTNQVVIGHHTKRGWFIDAAVTKTLTAGRDYNFGVSLKGTTVSVTLDGQSVLGFAFNAAVVDGQAGLLTRDSSSSFDRILIQTDDPAYRTLNAQTQNVAPVAANDSAATNPGTAVTLAVLANDSDGDGNPLTVSSLTQPQSGTIVLNSNGTLTYTPVANFVGTDTFTYKANDGVTESNIATVTITVSSANRAPIAVNDSVTTNKNTTTTINVLANDSDADGDALTVKSISQTTNGVVVLNANGTISYTPKNGFVGTDTLSYVTSDGTSNSSIATITVQVLDRAPVAVNDSGSTTKGTALTFSVLTNDSDPDGDPLSVGSFSQPLNGTVALNPNGTFTYQPKKGFTGTDTFSYKASDGLLLSTAATVTITVK